MVALNIEPTEITPCVKLNAETGLFIIEGKTLPENVNFFYEPILIWLNEYITNPKENTILEVKLEYINTASSKAIFSVFLKLEKLVNKGKTAKIKWFYADDDEDMKDVGEEYADVIKVPFEQIEFKAED
jgi:hypothetical protein